MDESRYGFPLDKWEQACEEVRRILIDCAKRPQTIAYSDLLRQVKAIHLAPDSYAVGAILGEVSESEDALGRGMLTVLVVHKGGDMRPGPGFFELAKKLDRDTSDIERCWVEEFKHVVGVWSGPNPQSREL
jgi:hypothetical protein